MESDRKVVNRMNLSEKGVSPILICKIIGEFFQADVEDDMDIVEYFGRFGKTGDIYQIFRSFQIRGIKDLYRIPISETLHIESWGEPFDLDSRFVKSCKKLNRLEGFIQIPKESLLEISKLNNMGYLFFFNINVEIDYVFTMLNKLPRLLGLGIFNQREKDACQVDLCNNSLKMFYFDRLPSNVTLSKTENIVDLSIAHSFVTNLQLRNIAKMKDLKTCLFCCCGYVEEEFKQVIERKTIESYNMKDCAIDLTVFERIILPEDSMISNIGFEGCFGTNEIPSSFLRQIFGLKSLQYVNLHRCKIGISFFQILLEGGLKSEKKKTVITLSHSTVEMYKDFLVAIQKKHERIDFQSFQNFDTDIDIDCLETVPGFRTD